MLEIRQELCNQIAAMPTEHTWMNELLRQPDPWKADEMEDRLWYWLKTLSDNLTVVRIVAGGLPMLMEHKAISMWLDQNPEMAMYVLAPESAWEAASIAIMDMNGGVDQKTKEEAVRLMEKIQEGEIVPPAEVTQP